MKAETTNGEAKAKPPAEINIEEFATAVATMSRFLTRLTALDAFKSAKVGLAEWSVLTIIAKSEGTNNKQIAKALGITGQRVNQLTESLSKSGMLTVSPSPDDGRKGVITITDTGKKSLAALNSSLTANLKSSLSGKERSVASVGKNMKRLMTIVRPPKKEKEKTA